MASDIERKTKIQEIFEEEHRVADEAEAVLTKTEVSPEELREQFKFLAKKYKSLLKQAIKITSIGDTTQGKLIKTQQQLDQQNEELEKKNKTLNEKNDALVRAHEALLQSQQKAESIFSALTEALPGTVLDDKYRLETKIGSGGYGAVFKSTHLTLGRDVAIKVLQPKSGPVTPNDLERFRREGISACRITHPNAVAVSDFGISTSGIAYLVMELLSGKTLTEELQDNGPLSVERSAELLIPVCSALEEAHSVGIVHRDIKPDNIFLHQGTTGEIVKVLDFGLAKLMGGDTQLSDMADLTCGVIVGTPTYLPPERLSNLPYDGRADIYSLGIVLYQMLTGKPPFQLKKGNIGALVTAHLLMQPPSLRETLPDIPEKLESFVMRTLAKLPSKRPTAKEFGEEMQTYVPRSKKK